ncbi:hypothetical protein NONO_c18050 [Nocardia nova SH22a]|uniref:Uncharacterized protein n=1 Tax=Nocardia nova SH22a TaxID=1415166 RepID=W5TB57_9NOCA|nr:hypothetical protein [Nocardia nova]AHH16605.1 hypothetical protein NONO_c18050 [Nocardia nova SH22a]
MNEPQYIGWLHTSDGIHRVGPDGFCDVAEAPELVERETRALDVPTIDVAPESVTDREADPN